MSTPTTPEPRPAPPERLTSLDALRGFDMLWIIGGDLVLLRLAEWVGLPSRNWWLPLQFQQQSANEAAIAVHGADEHGLLGAFAYGGVYYDRQTDGRAAP